MVDSDSFSLLAIGNVDFQEELSDELASPKRPSPVQAVSKASEALARLNTHTQEIDCVLCVHEPPDVDGLAVLDAIRKDFPELPVVIYATQSDESFAREILARDHAGYVARDPDASDRALMVAETLRSTLLQHRQADHKGDLRKWTETVDSVLTDATWQWDPTTDTLTISPRFAESFGVESDGQLRSADWWIDRVHPKDRPKNRELKAAIENGELRDFERFYRFRQGDGTYSYVLSRGQVTTDSDGNPHVVGILIKLESQIEYLARFHELVEYSVDTMSIVQPDGTVNYISPSVEQISGKDADAVIGENILDYVHPDDQGIVRETFEGLVDGSKQVAGPIEYRIRDGMGGWIWVESVARAPIEDLHIDGFLVNTRDITERKEHEQELRRFRLLVEQAGTAIYITDDEGIIDYVNPAYEEITGYTAEEAIGETPSLLNSGEQDSDYYQRLWDTVSSGEVWKELIVNRRKSGERYTAVQTIAPIQSSRDGITGYVAIQNDITERELNRQRLEVLNRVLRHNLRNELNVIEGHVGLLAEAAKDDHDVQSSVDSVSKTVDQLVSESEKAREIQDILQQELYADESVRDVIATLKGVARTFADARVVFEPVEGEDETVPAIMQRALTELLENAIIHNDREPDVSVSVQPTGDGDMEFKIEDNGPGLPEMEQHVLEDGHEEQLAHSQGLGLWIAYWLVQISGGSIEFEENNPRGTIFSVLVPCN
ncbi:PAS domain S-box protein [Halorientalis marina]|uniref:PAS domain S-box protein n=1 Tax=Halorientalis marina TaxID=2931976 RepID=UPI001FF65258|nr:PAS domain S-box protein [Halorientalis marina]